ncbi:exocyst complex component 1-like [Malaclemys terrapin pileata]|uniref:exocyst complex component 1-like n=1 Tax=Malaclemys terrapin pileata TaxID=2991368 RepID=UPI0023A7CC93|nr:exocyst complex component 1-like [Malaclemys terrapin pileata]
MSASLKMSLQDIVFRPKREKLVHVLELSMPSTMQREEQSYLCVTVTREKDVKITYLITVEEKTSIQYKIDCMWLLKDLTLIDGKEAMQDYPKFDMHFEHVYSWEAFSTAAKYAFTRCIRKMSKIHYRRDIEFVNFDDDYMSATGHFQVSEDTMLALKLCIQVLNCLILSSLTSIPIRSYCITVSGVTPGAE